MAYLARIDREGSQALVVRPPAVASAPALALVAPAPAPASTRSPSFSTLEWSVVELTRRDPLWTIRPLGPLRRFVNWLVGRANPQLANERLEALRRMAVLSRRFGFVVDGHDVRDFLAAGFTVEQYELLVSTVRVSRQTRPRANRAEAWA